MRIAQWQTITFIMHSNHELPGLPTNFISCHWVDELSYCISTSLNVMSIVLC